MCLDLIHSAGLLAMPLAAWVAMFAWAYWPTWRQLVHAWSTQADYSHGFLAMPLARGWRFLPATSNT